MFWSWKVQVLNANRPSIIRHKCKNWKLVNLCNCWVCVLHTNNDFFEGYRECFQLVLTVKIIKFPKSWKDRKSECNLKIRILDRILNWQCILEMLLLIIWSENHFQLDFHLNSIFGLFKQRVLANDLDHLCIAVLDSHPNGTYNERVLVRERISETHFIESEEISTEYTPCVSWVENEVGSHLMTSH